MASEPEREYTIEMKPVDWESLAAMKLFNLRLDTVQLACAPPLIIVPVEQNATADMTGAHLKEWRARVLKRQTHQLFTLSAKGRLHRLPTACDCPECAWNRKPLTWTEAAGLKLVDYPSKLRRWLRSHQAYRIKRFLWGRPIERLVRIAYRLRGRA